MTVEQIITEIYETLGEPTNLDIYDSGGSFDISTAGSVRLLRYVNQGIKRIVSYKYKSGRPIYFKDLESSLFFTTTVKTGTASGGANKSITLDTGVEDNADQYNDWVVEITGGTGDGQKRLIIDFDASRVATVHKAWTTNPDATSTYKVYKRFHKYLSAGDVGYGEHISVDDVNSFGTVWKVIDLEDEFELGRKERTLLYDSNQTTAGTPHVWYEYGNALWFDVNVDEERSYKIYYQKTPDNVTAGTDEPAIPAEFHDAIVLWAVQLGLLNGQETGDAYAYRRNFQDFLEQTVMEQEREYFYSESFLTTDQYEGGR